MNKKTEGFSLILNIKTEQKDSIFKITLTMDSSETMDLNGVDMNPEIEWTIQNRHFIYYHLQFAVSLLKGNLNVFKH